ncbi:PREDICTED: uncharacterized protein LOC106810565 [Priapulus caudatus]|uniref:Uncharacterized protein LOC106810565 n=1 Tax=Priapulus caudatus TaxID=37621 RepID=A0ABM1EB66_PRICU|nr:PREDICTED: uncharacterized protein LOC106810565 [Priapulus caudatus]
MRGAAALRAKLAVNSLWSLWYCVLVSSITAYLAKCNVRDYAKYRQLSWMPTSDVGAALHMYLALTVFAVVMLPCFVVAATLLVGNMANDGKTLGRNVSLLGDTRRSRASWLWRYTLPPSHVLHVLMAFCLLMAKLVMDGELVHHGFLRLDRIWATDIDAFMDGKDVRDTNITRAAATAAAAAAAAASGALPVSHDVMGASLEFVNFGVALLLTSVRYPSVFWSSNKAFSLMFSSFLVLSATYQAISFCGFCILHKIHVFGVRNVLDDRPLLLNTPQNVFAYLLVSALVFFSPAIPFWYGVVKYNHSLARQREKHCVYRNATSKFHVYRPHLCAMATLILTAACKAPLVYDALVFYSKIPSYVVGMAISVDICYLMLWILLWFVLTVKRTWTFRIEFAEMAKKSPNSLISGRSIEKTNLLVLEAPDYRDPAKKSLLNLLHVQKAPANNNDNWKHSLKRGRGSIGSAKKYRISLHDDDDADARSRATPTGEHTTRGINISGPIRSVFDTVPLAPMIPHSFPSTPSPEEVPPPTDEENEEEVAAAAMPNGWGSECENLLRQVSRGHYTPNVSNMKNLGRARDPTFATHADDDYDDVFRVSRTSSQPFLGPEQQQRRARPEACGTVRKPRPRVPNYARRSQTLHYGRSKHRPPVPPTLNSAVEMLRQCQFQNAFYYVPDTAPVTRTELSGSGGGGSGYGDDAHIYDRSTNMRMTSFTDKPDFPHGDDGQFPNPPDDHVFSDPDYTEIPEETPETIEDGQEQQGEEEEEDDEGEGEEAEDELEGEDEEGEDQEEQTPPNMRRQRRDSANYSLTDSNGNDDSDHYNYSNGQAYNNMQYAYPQKMAKQEPSKSDFNDSDYRRLNGYNVSNVYPQRSSGSTTADDIAYAYRYSDCGM